LPTTPLAPSAAHQTGSGFAINFQQNSRGDCQSVRVF
jgi:hypothetical protein